MELTAEQKAAGNARAAAPSKMIEHRGEWVQVYNGGKDCQCACCGHYYPLAGRCCESDYDGGGYNGEPPA